MGTMVPVNDIGRRIGESHPRSTVSDEMVTRIRDLHEYEGKSYPQIHEITGVALSTIGKICRYEIRGQYAARMKTLKA